MEIIYKHFESLSSTNAWAKAHLNTIPKGALLLVVADGQTAARGQYGRRWISPKGENIYATFAFHTEGEQDPLSLTHLLAISASRVLEERGIVCRLKWPNDLLVGQKKIAGILCELGPNGIVMGIGLNVNMSQESLNQIDQPAASLLTETGYVHDVQQTLSSLRAHFVTDFSLYLYKGFTPFLPLFRKLTQKITASGDLSPSIPFMNS